MAVFNRQLLLVGGKSETFGTETVMLADDGVLEDDSVGNPLELLVQCLA